MLERALLGRDDAIIVDGKKVGADHVNLFAFYDKRKPSEPYPDLRKCLNLVQLNSQGGELKEPGAADRSARDWRLECVDLFKRGKVRDARAVLCQNSSPEEAEDVFRWMYDNLDLWGDTPERQDQAIVIIRNGLVNHNAVADVEINLSATLIELAGIS